MKYYLILAFYTITSVAFAQIKLDPAATIDSTLEITTVEENINAVYIKFSESYRRQNADMAAKLYGENAFYIVGEAPMLRGRDEIKKNFKQFFKSIKSRDLEMTIEFKIIDRLINPTLAHDIGYYIISYFKKGNISHQSTGKFSTVLFKDEDGTWMFASDTYHNAHMNEYNDAKGLMLKF